MTTQTIQLATGHTAKITVHKGERSGEITYRASVTDRIGTTRTLAYGVAPCTRFAYRECSSAVRSFVGYVRVMIESGTYSITND